MLYRPAVINRSVTLAESAASLLPDLMRQWQGFLQRQCSPPNYYPAARCGSVGLLPGKGRGTTEAQQYHAYHGCYGFRKGYQSHGHSYRQAILLYQSSVPHSCSQSALARRRAFLSLFDLRGQHRLAGCESLFPDSDSGQRLSGGVPDGIFFVCQSDCSQRFQRPRISDIA